MPQAISCFLGWHRVWGRSQWEWEGRKDPACAVSQNKSISLEWGFSGNRTADLWPTAFELGWSQSSGKVFLGKWNFPGVWYFLSYDILVCLHAQLFFCQTPSVTLQSCPTNYFTPFCRTDWIRIKCYKNLQRRRFTLSLLITELQGRRLAAEQQQQIARDSPAAVLWIVCSIVSGALLLQNICKAMMQAQKLGLLFWDLDLSPFHSSPCSFFFSYCYRIPLQTDCCLKSR